MFGNKYSQGKKFSERSYYDNKSINIIISSKEIALYVFIDSDDFDFIASDNFFSMEPNESRVIVLKELKPLDPKVKFTEQKAKDSLRIGSLYDLLKTVKNMKRSAKLQNRGNENL